MRMISLMLMVIVVMIHFGWRVPSSACLFMFRVMLEIIPELYVIIVIINSSQRGAWCGGCCSQHSTAPGHEHGDTELWRDLCQHLHHPVL